MSAAVSGFTPVVDTFSVEGGGKEVPVVRVCPETKNDLFVILVPPPGSSPLTIAVAGEAQMEDSDPRVATAQHFAAAGVSSLIYCNPGKNGSLESERVWERQESTYAFATVVEELQLLLQSLLQKGVHMHHLTVSTSSLSSIPLTKLLLDHADFFQQNGYPQVMVGSPISTLTRVVKQQLGYQLTEKFPEISWAHPLLVERYFRKPDIRQKIAHQYARMYTLDLDPAFEKELMSPDRRKIGFAQLYALCQQHGFPLYAYGNTSDSYLSAKDRRLLHPSWYLGFDDVVPQDPFRHALTPVSQQQAVLHTTAFVQDIYSFSR